MAEDHVALCTVSDLSYLFIVTTISNLWLQQVNFLPVWRKKPHRVKLLFEKTIAPNGDSCHDESHNDNNNFDRGFQQKVRISWKKKIFLGRNMNKIWVRETIVSRFLLLKCSVIVSFKSVKNWKFRARKIIVF